MSVSTVVDKRPQCDMCRKAEAQYDGKTTSGPWAYMCLACYRLHGVGLGTGKGQRLYLAGEVQDEPLERVAKAEGQSRWRNGRGGASLADVERHSDDYEPEPVDYSAPTKYDIQDGEV